MKSELLEAWDVAVAAFRDGAGKRRSLTKHEQYAWEQLIRYNLRLPFAVGKGR